MSRKTIDNVRIVQWGNTLDGWEEANAKPGDHSLLKTNELGVINSSTGGAIALAIGDGASTVSDLYQRNIDGYTNNNIFFSGIGAGYQLPLASSGVLGGLKINPYYFDLQNEQLNPLLLRRATPDIITGKYYNSNSDTADNEPLTLPERHDLRIQGALFVDKIITEERVDIQVESNYINVHKKIDKEFVQEIECTTQYVLSLENTTILEKYQSTIIITDSSGNKIDEYSIYTDIQEEVPFTIFESASFVVGEIYTVSYISISDEAWVLDDEETAGLRIYNYHKDDASLPEEDREVAEISVKNDGSLWYSPNALGINDFVQRKRIALLDNLKAGMVFLSTDSELYTNETLPTSNLPTMNTLYLNEYAYNPLATGGDILCNIRQDYCDTIVANGQEYKVQDNKIDLGSPIWTEDLYNKLQSAVQTIKFNGTKYAGPNPEFNYTYSANINSGTLINVQKDGEKFTINHLQDAEYKDVIGYNQCLIGPNNETTIRVINTLNRDNNKMGHLMEYKDYLVDFTPLIEYIENLEKRIEDLENIINNL